jgi:type II secretory pathway pseudopilin PulG
MGRAMKHEKGNSLIEIIISLALLGTVSVLFLGGVINSTNARVSIDARSSSKILAEGIIDTVKKMNFDASYNVTIPQEFSTYSANLTVTSMSNGNIQKLTVVISHLNKQVLTLEDYKVNR